MDLPKEPDLLYLLKLMGRNGQTVGAPAGKPVKVITIQTEFLYSFYIYEYIKAKTL